jgi:hypothetical protein
VSSAIIFCPRPELIASENLRGFIESARRDLQVFGEDLSFGEHVWDVTDFVELKGRGNKRVRINFYAFCDDARACIPMREPYLSFANAYYRYMHGLRPKKFVHGRLYALKSIAQALETELGTAQVELINGHIFDTAAGIIRIRYDTSLAYRVGGDLEQLATFLTENAFTAVPVPWRNILPRPSDTQRVGKEFDERRAAKMPSEAALEALPQIFQLATEPIDILITSMCVILLAAPSRISEVQLMPVECEVTQPVKGESRTCLRWWPSKGAPPMLKPVYSGMSDVVQTAIIKLKEVGAPARHIAKWYEDNPERMFLPPGTEHLRSACYLRMNEIAQIVGVTDGWQWCRDQKLHLSTLDGRAAVLFADVERNLCSLLPQGFPFLNRETGLKYSNALLLVRKNELHSNRATYRCMIEPVPTDTMNLALGAKDRATIFDKFEFTEPDGSKIKITTHQFRHYLNTVAQMGGLSQLDIAKWSGRVDVRQNAAYDHVSTDEMLVRIRAAVGDSSIMFGPLGGAHDRRLISRDEFAQLKVPTAHTTELGFCIHDFTMAPCEIHRDCINCEELVCVKGASTKTGAIKRQLTEARSLLERAEAADRNGSFGADRWVVHQRATVERLEQLCSLLDDASVPAGAFITLARSAAGAQLGRGPQLRLIDGEGR